MCPSMQDTVSTSADIFAPSYNTGNTSFTPAPATLRRTKSTDKTKTLLPVDFVPTEYSVICGNKRAFFNSVGNRRFRVICQMHLAEYMNAPSKHEKSFVVTKVMKVLRDACPVGAFIAFEKGCWWEVSDRTSREKIGTFFRDCLSDSYKSSSKNKVAQRKKKRSCSPSPSRSCSPSPMDMQPIMYSSPIPSTKAVVTASGLHAPTPITPLTTPTTAPTAMGSFIAPPMTPPVSRVVTNGYLGDDTSMRSSASSLHDVEDDFTPLPL